MSLEGIDLEDLAFSFFLFLANLNLLVIYSPQVLKEKKGLNRKFSLSAYLSIEIFIFLSCSMAENNLRY